MKKVIHITLALTICISIFGCATKYKHKGIKGGYSETKLGDDTYSVRFQGNGYCSADKAGDFCLLRCADLTRENGYKYFKVVQSEERALAESQYGTTTSEKSRNHNTIKLYKDKPEGDNVYEAKVIIKSIKEKYHVKSIED